MKAVAIYKLIGGAIIFSTAYLLRVFYSRADSADLFWIIGPTARLVEIFTSLSFSPEAGYGWVDVTRNVVIAPVCAGVNFLIIAFCMSAFQILWKKHSPGELTAGILLAGAASFLLTVVANAMRIVLAVALFKADIYNHWLTPDMVHRVAGIVVYYLLLCFYAQALNCGCSGKRSQRQVLLLVPLCWYLLFSVGVPLANQALDHDPELFLRHAVTIALVTALVTLILYRIQRWYILVRKNLYLSHQRTDSPRN